MFQSKSVIFEFDYTLADSSKGACECINFALSRMNLEKVPAAAANKTIGLSLAKLASRGRVSPHCPSSGQTRFWPT